jgi:hypothetical protein
MYFNCPLKDKNLEKHVSNLNWIKFKSAVRMNMVFCVYTWFLHGNWIVFFHYIRNVELTTSMTDLKGMISLTSPRYVHRYMFFFRFFFVTCTELCMLCVIDWIEHVFLFTYFITLILLLVCGYGWLKYKAHCYLYGTRKLSWKDAQV